MWLLQGPLESERVESRWLRPGTVVQVGRNAAYRDSADVYLANHKRVSREIGWIKSHGESVQEVEQVQHRPDVLFHCLSRKGADLFRRKKAAGVEGDDGQVAERFEAAQRLEPESTTTLQDGDKVRFSSQAPHEREAFLQLVWQPVVLLVHGAPKTTLVDLAQSLENTGVKLVRKTWTRQCTHLVMTKARVTKTACEAMIDQAPIVSQDWLDRLIELLLARPSPLELEKGTEVESGTDAWSRARLPRLQSYPPPIDPDEPMDPATTYANFEADSMRASIFQGLHFVFADEEQARNASYVVTGGRGTLHNLDQAPSSFAQIDLAKLIFILPKAEASRPLLQEAAARYKRSAIQVEHVFTSVFTKDTSEMLKAAEMDVAQITAAARDIDAQPDESAGLGSSRQEAGRPDSEVQARQLSNAGTGSGSASQTSAREGEKSLGIKLPPEGFSFVRRPNASKKPLIMEDLFSFDDLPLPITRKKAQAASPATRAQPAMPAQPPEPVSLTVPAAVSEPPRRRRLVVGDADGVNDLAERLDKEERRASQNATAAVAAPRLETQTERQEEPASAGHQTAHNNEVAEQASRTFLETIKAQARKRNATERDPEFNQLRLPRQEGNSTVSGGIVNWAEHDRDEPNFDALDTMWDPAERSGNFMQVVMVPLMRKTRPLRTSAGPDTEPGLANFKRFRHKGMAPKTRPLPKLRVTLELAPAENAGVIMEEETHWLDPLANRPKAHGSSQRAQNESPEILGSQELVSREVTPLVQHKEPGRDISRPGRGKSRANDDEFDDEMGFSWR